MTNENLTTAVINRLKQFMEQVGVSVTQFADNTGIQRSSMSQILGGRNQKISIITIGKIHDAYPNLSLTWLLSGEGTMMNGGELVRTNPDVSIEAVEMEGALTSEPELPFLALFGNENAVNAGERAESPKYPKENGSKRRDEEIHLIEKEDVISVQSANIEVPKSEQKNKQVVKIMIFYSDNTFETFSPDSGR